jgi:hypothetical protein
MMDNGVNESHRPEVKGRPGSKVTATTCAEESLFEGILSWLDFSYFLVL